MTSEHVYKLNIEYATHSAVDIGYTDETDKEFIESVEAVNKALRPEYIPFRSEPKVS